MTTRIALAASLFLMAALAGCGGTGPTIGGAGGDFWKEYDRTRGGGGGGGDGSAG